MSRTKKNWDVLVDDRGNYDFVDLFKGGEGDKGNKGDVGPKGNKGEKGQKGEKGIKGSKGEPAPTFTYQGEVDDFGSLPPNPDPGDVYRDKTTGDLYAYGEDGDWNTIPGIQPLKGQKGEKGEKGQKGIQGRTGDKGEVGEKGQKGEVGEKGVKGNRGPEAGFPVGSIIAYAGSTAPSGWLMCDGSSITGNYPDLKAIVGNNTPNLKGRFLGGAGSNGIALRTPHDDSTRKPRHNSFSMSANSGGDHTHTFSDSGTTGSNGSHVHNMGTTGQVSGDKSGGRFTPNTSGPSKTGEAGDHTHSFSVSGTTGQHNGHTHTVGSSNWDSYTRPHTYGVNYIIKHD